MNRTGGVKGYFVVVLALLLAGLRMPTASAHIVHPGNAFADIGLSAYQDEIVYASRLGLIASEEGGDVFRPGEPLQRADLAHWAAAFDGLADAKDAANAAKAALTSGLVDSLEGNATYQDINQAVFRDTLVLKDSEYPAEQQVTREQYAAFVTAFAFAEVEGQRLEERAGFSAGPAGLLKAKTNSDATFGYELEIDGKTWMLSKHPRVIHAPGDPSLWDGRILAASWVTVGESGGAVLELLDFRDTGGVQNTATEVAETPAAAAPVAGHVHDEMSSEQHEQSNASGTATWLIVLGGVALAAVIAYLAWNRRHRSAD